MKIVEPATMLTDYLLAAVSLVLAFKLFPRKAFSWQDGRFLWSIGFVIAATAAVTGGTFHGFALYLEPATRHTLWIVTVYLIGAATGFMLSGTFVEPRKSKPILIAGLAVTLVGLAVVKSKIQLHPSFNHNDLYHLIQIGAFYLFYRGMRPPPNG
jgi:hypothetical protein